MTDNDKKTETDLSPQFARDAVEIVSREAVFEGFFTMQKLRLRHRLFRGGWSSEIERELFVRGAAVGVLLYDPVHELVALTEQFRIGALDRPEGPWCLEVVAGMVEESESLEAVARRELQEEAGLEVEQLHYIRSYMPSPGGSSERLHLFCALADLRGAEGHFGLDNEHEDIRLRVLPLQAVFDVLESHTEAGGPIDNAATVISLQWLQLNRARMGGG
ncbi:NUDIX domain-containing protein [Microbulbifer rhizosphaerae]|uniref:ADP-ribose pyrophosphatase n=1 Tax=Microbulbifer rhizosphaerae TaxID=1562603 RepID=A0A7W4ZB58_9GAMM|nr:NUDIX domain-containing protein [Microbulbifer rhizosphaerae]MBB3062054.1 ADP-ribose pyrophosphatase [Microbulbifer rhizosphaerae]